MMSIKKRRKRKRKKKSQNKKSYKKHLNNSICMSKLKMLKRKIINQRYGRKFFKFMKTNLTTKNS